MVKINYLGNEPVITGRYLIFAYRDYEAHGGLDDVLAEADTLEELITELAEVKEKYSGPCDDIRLYDREVNRFFEVVSECLT